VIRSLPTFRELKANFPDHARFRTPTLLNSIGGQVRQNLKDADNTCAVRLSYTLIKSGTPIRHTPGVHALKGAPHVVPSTAHHAHPTMASDLYVFRVLEMKEYLVKHYGPGALVYNGYRATHFVEPPPIKGSTQGIIAFTWQGPFNDFGASGHVDLYQGLLTGNPQTMGANCVGQCYFLTGPMIAHFWEVRP
jgi:hypothetical protein